MQCRPTQYSGVDMFVYYKVKDKHLQYRPLFVCCCSQFLLLFFFNFFLSLLLLFVVVCGWLYVPLCVRQSCGGGHTHTSPHWEIGFAQITCDEWNSLCHIFMFTALHKPSAVRKHSCGRTGTRFTQIELIDGIQIDRDVFPSRSNKY